MIRLVPPSLSRFTRRVGCQVATLAAVALPSVAAAQDLQVQIDPAAAQRAGIDSDQAEADLRASTDTSLKVDDQRAFLDQMAHATALSTRGMGVDYASNPQKVVFGMSFGTAVSGAGAQFGRGGIELPEGGFAGGLSAMVGVNLGAGAEDDSFARRLRLYGNGFYARPTYAPFRGTVLNYGGHLQVQVLRHRDGDVVEWGGLALTTGFQETRFSMDLEDGIPIDTGDVEWDATGAYGIDAVSRSVPVELSTNLRLLVATAFVGFGVDTNLTSVAQSDLSLEGDLTAGPNDTKIGTASLTLADSGVGDFVVPRAFAGLQADIFFVKAYGQLNIGFNDSFGGHLGLRVAL